MPWLVLEGDAKLKVEVAETKATRIIMECNEGGMARFRCNGAYVSQPEQVLKDCLDGASIFGASDASYGDPALVLRSRRQGQVMAGWESCRHSARHRLCIRLKQACLITRAEIDT
jgi:allantoicase